MSRRVLQSAWARFTAAAHHQPGSSFASSGPLRLSALPLAATQHCYSSLCGLLSSSSLTFRPVSLPYPLLDSLQKRSFLSTPRPKAKKPKLPQRPAKWLGGPCEYPKWLNKRFIMDRNKVIWHVQTGRFDKNFWKSSRQKTRLKRLKPLYKGFATKLKKLNFKRRYWLYPGETPGQEHDPKWYPDHPPTGGKVIDPIPDIVKILRQQVKEQGWVPPKFRGHIWK